MIYIFIVILIVAFDQLSKWIVVTNMELHQSIPLIDGWLHITSARNRGAAFSILEDQIWFFILITLIAVTLLSYLIYRYGREDRLLGYTLALILGGALGNLIDRVLAGEVVDFIDFAIINFPIFNIADIGITIGTGLLIIYVLFNKNNKLFN